MILHNGDVFMDDHKRDHTSYQYISNSIKLLFQTTGPLLVERALLNELNELFRAMRMHANVGAPLVDDIHPAATVRGWRVQIAWKFAKVLSP